MKCYLCKKPITNEDESRCYGCDELFCGACPENSNVRFGKHEPFEHQDDYDE